MPRVVYSRNYNIGFYGLERLHPFDSRKYGRVWGELHQRFGPSLRRLHVRPSRPATRDELLSVHTHSYLQKLQCPQYLARALEVPPIRYLPWWAADFHILRPMRWATRGTVVAAQEAIQHGVAINLGGGYHHAKPDGGEGFSIYSDAGLAVASLREQGLIEKDAGIICVDTDAHQGNGVCHTFMEDKSVFIFDAFNSEIYPNHDVAARSRVDCPVPLQSHCKDGEYMRERERRLPPFLDSVCNARVGLAIYNAGSDVLEGDPLGGLSITAAMICERDLFVVLELRKRKIPTVMVLSGGYTRQSFQVIADSVATLLDKFA